MGWLEVKARLLVRDGVRFVTTGRLRIRVKVIILLIVHRSGRGDERLLGFTRPQSPRIRTVERLVGALCPSFGRRCESGFVDIKHELRRSGSAMRHFLDGEEAPQEYDVHVWEAAVAAPQQQVPCRLWQPATTCVLAAMSDFYV